MLAIKKYTFLDKPENNFIAFDQRIQKKRLK